MSSTKKVLTKFKLADAQSLGASFDTQAFACSMYDRVEIQINATSTDAVGTFLVQCSLDSINWTALPLDAMTISSANKTIYIDISTTGIQILRVDYTRSSGGATDHVTIFVAGRES